MAKECSDVAQNVNLLNTQDISIPTLLLTWKLSVTTLVGKGYWSFTIPSRKKVFSSNFSILQASNYFFFAWFYF